MSLVEQFPYRDRNPASSGVELMPDLPVVLRHPSHKLSGVGLVDSGARSVRLAFAWANSDQVPFLLGQFNFFQALDVCFLRARGIFEIRQAGASSSP